MSVVATLKVSDCNCTVPWVKPQSGVCDGLSTYSERLRVSANEPGRKENLLTATESV